MQPLRKQQNYSVSNKNIVIVRAICTFCYHNHIPKGCFRSASPECSSCLYKIHYNRWYEWINLCLFAFKVPCTRQQGVFLFLLLPCTHFGEYFALLTTHLRISTSIYSHKFIPYICWTGKYVALHCRNAVCWRCGTFLKQFQICKTGAAVVSRNALNTNTAHSVHSKQQYEFNI